MSIPIPTVFYRRHDTNDSVLEKPSINGFAKKAIFVLLKPFTARGRLYQILSKGQAISRCLVERYEACLSPEQRSLLIDFANLQFFSPIHRRVKIIEHGLWFRKLSVNIVYFLMI